MRILVATSDYPPETGGMAVYSAAWVRELEAAGLRTRVLVRRAVTGPVAAARRGSLEDPVEVAWKRGYLRDPWHAGRALTRALDDWPADIVLAHTWIGWGPALAWLKGRTGQRYVLAAHGAEILGPASSRWYRPLLEASFRAADRIFPVSAFTADHVAALGISWERIRTIGNGIDAARYHPAPRSERLVREHGLEGCRVVVTVGGLVDRKGQDIVIRAMSLLRASHPDLRYLVVGGWALHGSREEDLKRLARECGVSDRVIFTGSVPDGLLPDYYRLGDVFALTGREVVSKGWVEGFGISLLEAAACGIPVVATLTGGVADAVDDLHARIVPPEDPAATADAIAALVDDPELRARMGAAGAAWASERTWTDRVRGAVRELEGIRAPG